MSAVVFGGYGVFGGHVARELRRLGVPVTIAGRDRARAEAAARALGRGHRGVFADITRPESCRAALQGAKVAVHCAGPFAALGTSLLEACLEAKVPYVDIADDRAYERLVREYGPQFAYRGIPAVYGCSSLPGISGALALMLREGAGVDPMSAGVCLFIGDNNPKGDAAVESVVQRLGQPIEVPKRQAESLAHYGKRLVNFGASGQVGLPQPFGRRPVYPIDSPEYDLFPPLLHVDWVTVSVGFELRLAAEAFRLLAALPRPEYRSRAARYMKKLARLTGWAGHSGGVVMTGLLFPRWNAQSLALSSPENGQRMAALPAALAAKAILDGETRAGAMAVYELIEPRKLIDAIVAEGYVLTK